MQHRFEAIGTHWDIECDSSTSLEDKILKRIADFDKAYSRFRDDSLIAPLYDNAGEITLPDDAVKMLEFYFDMFEITNGKVTPLIGKPLEQAGYDKSYTLTPNDNVSSPPSFTDVISYSHPILKASEPVVLDFGAAGKGYLIDLVADVLEKHGTKKYVIDAGGDIKVLNQTIKIGLEHPNDNTKAIGAAEVKGKSIASSAGNRRAWDKYNHILDPETASSPENIIATWVVADTAMLADGMATSLFFTEPKSLSAKFSFEYLVLYKDMSAKFSDMFKGTLFK